MKEELKKDKAISNVAIFGIEFIGLEVAFCLGKEHFSKYIKEIYNIDEEITGGGIMLGCNNPINR